MAACTNCSPWSGVQTSVRRGARPRTFHPPISRLSIETATCHSAFRCRCSGWDWSKRFRTQTILSNLASTASSRAALGIAGMPNRSGNDGTITRFGWKAQNKSAGHVRRRSLQRRDGRDERCVPNQHGRNGNLQPGEKRAERHHANGPNDLRNQGFQNPLHILPDWLEFAIFMRQTGPAAAGAFLAERPAGAATVRHGGQQPGDRLFSLPHAGDGHGAADMRRKRCKTWRPTSIPTF